MKAIILDGNNQRLHVATFQRKSMNSKLSHVDQIPFKGRFQTHANPPYVCSTYVSIEATCPDTCRFKNAGCYVQTGQAAYTMRRLDAAARGMTTHPNILEANLIDGQWSDLDAPPGRPGPKANRVPQDGPRGKGRPLRLHVGGDVRDTEGASALAYACEAWRDRDGGPVWTYTHRWREVPFSAWGPAISALASVETVPEAEEAVELGYMPSFTMASFEQDTAYKMGSVKVVPCPAQTRDLKCVDCQMCFKKKHSTAPALPKGTAVGFAWHGRQMSGKRQLDVIQQEYHGQQQLEL